MCLPNFSHHSCYPGFWLACLQGAAVTGTFWATWLTQGEVQLLRSGPRGFQSPRAGRHWNEAIPVEIDKKAKEKEMKRPRTEGGNRAEGEQERDTWGKVQGHPRPPRVIPPHPRKTRSRRLSSVSLSQPCLEPLEPELFICPISVLKLAMLTLRPGAEHLQSPRYGAADCPAVRPLAPPVQLCCSTHLEFPWGKVSPPAYPAG